MVPPSAVAFEIKTCAPAARPKGASVQAVTVVGVTPVEAVAGQPGAVAVAAATVISPSTRLLTVTVVETLGAKPTAPFQVNAGLVTGFDVDAHGVYEPPEIAPSVVAGSPGTSGVAQLELLEQPGQGRLKISGTGGDGGPAATSANPESGPNENMNVCVPSASVIKPSPPEICWHLMAPFTVPAVGA